MKSAEHPAAVSIVLQMEFIPHLIKEFPFAWQHGGLSDWRRDMFPVPFHQLIDFVSWIHEQHPNASLKEIEEGYLRELAMSYLRGGGHIEIFQSPEPTHILISLLKVFQICPMITEPDVLDQMRHFSGCGSCLEYIERENMDPRQAELHPLLRRFVDSDEGRDLIEMIRRMEPSSLYRELRGDRNRRALDHLIHELGPHLQRSFEHYLGCVDARELIEDYQQNRGRLTRFTSQQMSIDYMEDGTKPLGVDEGFEISVMRLADSVRMLIKGNFYQEQMRQNPEVARLLLAVGMTTENAAQAVEFIWWLQERYPSLDILASVPVAQVREIVTQFCEDKNYKNAASFSKDVAKWLKGEAERGILQRLVDIGTRAKRGNKTYRMNVAPFERYQTVPYHAMFLFLSAGDFPGFIQKYWNDLNYLTGDYLDVYYSYDDVEHRVSAFEVLEQFRSLQVDATALPAILLWEKSLSNSCLVPLEKLPHDDVFDTVKLIVQRIKEERSLQEICDEANELVESKLEVLTQGPKIIVQRGDVRISGDTYNVGQAGAVGPNAHAHDMTFAQIDSQIAQSVDFSKLAEELSTLRQAMKKEAKEPKQKTAVSEIVKAEQAAKAKDASKVAEHLASAGKWALDVATAVGVPVAIEALKKALSLG